VNAHVHFLTWASSTLLTCWSFSFAIVCTGLIGFSRPQQRSSHQHRRTGRTTPTGTPMPKTTTRHKGTRTMKKIAIALTALSLFAAPALAESIHHDGPYSGFASAQTTTQSTSGDFGATVTGSGTSGNSGKVLITVGEDLNR
jgi:hypothetical protein